MPDRPGLDITSPSNPVIRSAAALRRRRERDRTGRFLVEGRRETSRAFDAGLPVVELFIAPELAGDVDPILDMATGVKVPVRTVSSRAFAKLSGRSGPDGVLAVAETPPFDLDRAIAAELLLVAEGIEKPGNLGAMVRTADAAGAGVLVVDPVVDPVNPSVIRASQGTIFFVPVGVTSTPTAIEACGDRRIVVGTPEARRRHWDLDMTGPTAIVVGPEDTGVSEPWRTAGEPVAVPMRGRGDSLNASVAAAVLLYEAVRQRSVSGLL